MTIDVLVDVLRLCDCWSLAVNDGDASVRWKGATGLATAGAKSVTARVWMPRKSIFARYQKTGTRRLGSVVAVPTQSEVLQVKTDVVKDVT